METNMKNEMIRDLIDSHDDGFALDRAFYTDAEIYKRDISEVFLKSWLYAGHSSEIPKTGDWFLFELGGESVIIVRSEHGEINALLNVCRHRGSRICLESRGCSKKLVCRYHGWAYELDGQLRGAAHMKEDFDKSGISLKRIHTEVLDGMIYVNFAENPVSFDSVREGLQDCLRPYRIDKAKVAHRETFPIDANWKLSLENYTECYHCAPAHPEYSKGHSLAKPEARSDDLLQQVMAMAESCGLSGRSVNRTYMGAEGSGADYAYERYAMWRGHVTGSEDGKPVAPLMGDIKDYDGGTTDIQVGPVTYGLAYCDHIVIYRFTPVSLDKSECDITWLVNGDAEEGVDYDKAKLIWLWDVTTEADKRIIENNAKGVNSRFYQAGPLSLMEEFTGSFISWYLHTIRP
jgi:phenylpropionate dioxygenase-like ring-hydroxylating dioxygenase large terminal subunit